jgi:hypothetical protein
MRKNIGWLLILGVSTLSLTGCLFRRVAGPCYGVGCPAFSASGTQKTAVAPQPASGNTQARKSAAAEPSNTAASPAAASQAGSAEDAASKGDTEESKPGAFTRLLRAMHLHSKS